MTNLRDGSQVEDPRLACLVDFDERSRNFPVAELTAGKPLRKYTWRCLNWLDQGREGSCVGAGIGHELIARPSESKVDMAYCRDNIYWEAQKIDQWDGGAYPGAKPFYEGTSVLAGLKVGQKLGWFDSYRWAFNFEDLLLGIGHNGPAVLGIPWLEGMSNTDSLGYIRATGAQRGRHCILARAVDPKNMRVLLRNSWGWMWGVDGDCWIGFVDLEKLLANKGEAAFVQKRHKKAVIR